MIEQGQGPEPPEEEEKGKDKKRGKRRNFLLSWLAAREGASIQETSDDDTESPRKGFSALWRRMFERDVQMEPIEEPEPNNPAESAEDILQWWPKIDQPEDSTHSTHEIEETGLPITEKTEPMAPEKAREETETPAEMPEFANYPLPSTRELQEQIRMLSDSEPASSGPELPIASKSLVDAKEAKPEILVNKKEPLAAVTLLGLGVEYLGRKKQGRNQEKRIRGLERKVNDHDKKTARLEMELPRRETREKTYQSREQRPIRNAEAQPEIRISKSESQDAAKEQVGAAIKTERIAEEVAKKVEKYEKQHEAPGVVLKEMLKAAEANAPVERIYERRQEIKDEVSPVYNYSSAVPVSAILKKLSGTSQANTGLYPAASGNLQPSPLNTKPELYKQAAQRGFWGAIVIVIFMLMVYLFM